MREGTPKQEAEAEILIETKSESIFKIRMD